MTRNDHMIASQDNVFESLSGRSKDIGHKAPAPKAKAPQPVTKPVAVAKIKNIEPIGVPMGVPCSRLEVIQAARFIYHSCPLAHSLVDVLADVCVKDVRFLGPALLKHRKLTKQLHQIAVLGVREALISGSSFADISWLKKLDVFRIEELDLNCKWYDSACISYDEKGLVYSPSDEVRRIVLKKLQDDSIPSHARNLILQGKPVPLDPSVVHLRYRDNNLPGFLGWPLLAPLIKAFKSQPIEKATIRDYLLSQSRIEHMDLSFQAMMATLVGKFNQLTTSVGLPHVSVGGLHPSEAIREILGEPTG
jgi:hypothetical protein